MKSKAAKKPADEDEAKSKKIRSSRGKRRGGRHSRSRSPSSSGSGSDSPPRKRSKKSTKKVVDKKSKKHKGSSTSRRRHRSPSPSTSPSSSPSSVSRSRSHSRRSRHSSISASERSVSPLPRSHPKDTRKGKGRGRDRDRGRKRRRARRSRSYSSSPASSGNSQSRSMSRSKTKSRKRRAGGTREDATRDRTVQNYDNYLASRTERNSIEDTDRDEEAVAVATKGIDDYEKNVVLERRESSPSKDSKEMGEILSPMDGNATDEILPVGSGSPEVEEDLELILRQKALENFRKFKEAAVMPGKTVSNGTGKRVLTDSLQNTSTEVAEGRSAVTPSRVQGNSFGVGHSAGSPELEDFENGTSPWDQETSLGDRSPGVLEASDTSGRTQQQESRLELFRPISRNMSQDGRNGCSVMQRLGKYPASSVTVKQRLGSSTGVIPVQATRRVRSVVSIPAREGLDGSEFTMTPSACENPVPAEIISEVRHPPVEINNNLEGTNGDDGKTGEASAPDSSVSSAVKGKSQGETEDKDGSQFEKRTFSRMHDGETVQVSYKVYIPTTSPRLARRKLQR